MESPTDLAAKRMAWDLETRKSVELRVRTEIVPGKGQASDPAIFAALEEHYIEAGGKRFCDVRTFMKPDENSGHQTHFDNGLKCAEVQYKKDDLERPQYITIKRQYYKENMGDRMERPLPLLFLHVGRQPLNKALNKARYLGTDKVLGRECEVFLFAGVRWSFPQDHVYYLDKATSIPVKVISYRDEGSREANQPLWAWTAESLDEVQGHFVPLRSIMVGYDEAQRPAYEWKYLASSVEFDKDYPDSTFWPTFEPGVGVLDTITSKGYQVPGGKKEAVVFKGSAASSGRPIEAVAPGGWTAGIPWASFVLGCAILLAGGVLWWRHR